MLPNDRDRNARAAFLSSKIALDYEARSWSRCHETKCGLKQSVAVRLLRMRESGADDVHTKAAVTYGRIDMRTGVRMVFMAVPE